MMNYSCIVKDEGLNISPEEVDYAEWLSVEDAVTHIKKGSLAKRFLEAFVSDLNKK